MSQGNRRFACPICKTVSMEGKVCKCDIAAFVGLFTDPISVGNQSNFGEQPDSPLEKCYAEARRLVRETGKLVAERDALKARVTELEAYLAGWVKISERNPPVPGIYKVMVTRPIHGGSFVSHIRWDGQLWESLNVGPIDYQIVAWYDNGLEI